jgi:hypothetical protein
MNTTILSELHLIEERILTWPDSVPTWAIPAMDADAAFESLEGHLLDVLTRIGNLPEKEKLLFKPILEEFEQRIKDHHKKIEVQLLELQHSFSTNMSYLNAAKAYNQF